MRLLASPLFFTTAALFLAGCGCLPLGAAAQDTPPASPACDKPANLEGKIAEKLSAMQGVFDQEKAHADAKMQCIKEHTVKTKTGGANCIQLPDPEGPPQTSDQPVFYLATGQSYCGDTYVDDDAVACIDAGWLSAAHKSSCYKNVLVEFPKMGTSAQARVLDQCGNRTDPDNAFNCDDIYVSKSVFLALAADDGESLDKGRLSGSVTWRFINESCVFCEGGYYGILPDGSAEDPCFGADHFGIERHGRKVGDDRTFGDEAEAKCPLPPVENSNSGKKRRQGGGAGGTPGAQAKLQRKAAEAAEHRRRAASKEQQELEESNNRLTSRGAA